MSWKVFFSLYFVASVPLSAQIKNRYSHRQQSDRVANVDLYSLPVRVLIAGQSPMKQDNSHLPTREFDAIERCLLSVTKPKSCLPAGTAGTSAKPTQPARRGGVKGTLSKVRLRGRRPGYIVQNCV
jgi:hypothetical protein